MDERDQSEIEATSAFSREYVNETLLKLVRKANAKADHLVCLLSTTEKAEAESSGGEKKKLGNPLSPLNNRFYLLAWHRNASLYYASVLLLVPRP